MFRVVNMGYDWFKIVGDSGFNLYVERGSVNPNCFDFRAVPLFLEKCSYETAVPTVVGKVSCHLSAFKTVSGTLVANLTIIVESTVYWNTGRTVEWVLVIYVCFWALSSILTAKLRACEEHTVFLRWFYCISVYFMRPIETSRNIVYSWSPRSIF